MYILSLRLNRLPMLIIYELKKIIKINKQKTILTI